MKTINPPKMTSMPVHRLRNHILAAFAVLAVGAHAQTIHVGGESAIADASLPVDSGTALVPNTGGKWAAVSGADVSYSRLITKTVTIPTSGEATLKFNHRYFLEDDWDGGAVYVSINSGPFTYLDGSSFSQEGYDKVMSSSGQGGPFPDLESVFTGQSAGWGTPAYLESIASLGSLTAGDTVAVQFRTGWDWAYTEAAPNWEISTVQILDSAATLVLDSDFSADGPSGYTVVSDPSVSGPWAYEGTSINQFEIDASDESADRYVPATPGSVIDLNGAKLKVVLLAGELAAGKTFSLFDLSGGSTLAGTYSSIELPPVTWDLSGLEPGGNGQIVALTGTIWTYTWNNTTAGTYDWETANWDYAPTDPAPATVWPDGVGTIANLNAAAGNNIWTVTASSTTLGELHFGAVGGAAHTINGPGKTLVFDNGPINAEITRGDVSTTCGASMNFGAITLNSDLDVNITSHITSGLTINAPIGGTGGLNVYNAWGDSGWPGLQIVGVHTYEGGTTLNNATLTLPDGTSILNDVVMSSGTLRIAYPSTPKTQGQIVSGAISGTGTIMTEGRLTFDDDTNSWQGPLQAIGNFPGPIKFTSIGNVSEGPSALGDPQNADQGKIYLQGGGSSLEYIGAGDTTDRIIEMNCFGDFWTTSILASGSTTLASPFKITSNLAGSGTGWLVLAGTGVGEWAGVLGTNASRIQKNDVSTWILSGNNTYTGVTQVNGGTLILNGDSTGGSTVTVVPNARLGGNGSTTSAVEVNAGGKLLIDIPDWSGVAGTGFTDLQAASVNFSGAWTLDISSATAYANFTDASKTFPFLVTTGGITGFVPENVTIVAGSGFAGVGTWSVQLTGDTLELVYTNLLTATTTLLDASLNPSVEGQEVTFTATVMEEGVPQPAATGSMVFRVDGDIVATVSPLVDGQATYSTSALLVGDRAITATYSGDDVYSGSVGSLTQTVEAAPPNPYQTWDDEYEADLSDPAADEDGDGRINFEEFAFGLDPTDPTSVNPITDISSLQTNGTFSYTRRVDSGLAYTIWYSTDLQDWTEDPTASQDQTTPGPGAGAETVLVELSAIPVDTRFFLRVKAAPPLVGGGPQ